MEEKMFEFMTKMYSDMQNEFNKLNDKVQNGFKEIRQNIVKLEDKMDKND